MQSVRPNLTAPRAGSGLRLRAARLAFIASAEGTQKGERIEAGRVAALKRDLDRVLADQAYVLDAQLVGCEVLDASEAAGRTAFATALRARASPPELLTRVGASVAALPCDLHDLPIAVDVDVDGKRIGVLQLPLFPP